MKNLYIILVTLLFIGCGETIGNGGLIDVGLRGLLGGLVFGGIYLFFRGIIYFHNKIFYPTPKLKDMDLKSDYLLDKCKRLVGSVQPHYEEKIKDIQVNLPGPNKIWYVKMYLKNHDVSYDILKITDDELSKEISLIEIKKEIKNKDKKYQYLFSKYNNLIGTIDEKIKKEIVDIKINKPGLSKVWSIDMYVKNTSFLSGNNKDKYELFRINDVDLEEEILKNN